MEGIVKPSSFKSLLLGRAAQAGVLSGAAYGLLGRLVGATNVAGGAFVVMTVGFIFLVPLAMGYLTVRPTPHASRTFKFFAPWISCVLVVAASMIAGLEGAICVIFALPVMLLSASLGGFLAGSPLGRSRAGLPAVVLLPWAMVGLEQGTALPERHVVTTTQIEIAAPVAAVWPLVVSVDSIREAEQRPAMFTAIGFPRPIAATLDHPGVGGVRTASFERGVVFREAVTDWEPGRRIRFTIDATAVPKEALDPHVTIGGPFFDVLTGTYELHALSPTRTLLVLRSEHRVSTRFNPYASWWANRVMESVQDNILHVLRARAERARLG
ncbi:MAG: SRPBCC family protein [Gemmatimonadaceae bacterium]